MVSVPIWELYMSPNWTNLYYNWCVVFFYLFEERYAINWENMLNEVWESAIQLYDYAWMNEIDLVKGGLDCVLPWSLAGVVVVLF